MTTINISLPDQMKEFVEEEMGEGGYRDPSDYFNALLQEQLNVRPSRSWKHCYRKVWQPSPRLSIRRIGISFVASWRAGWQTTRIHQYPAR
jgi:hypothetical protein